MRYAELSSFLPVLQAAASGLLVRADVAHVPRVDVVVLLGGFVRTSVPLPLQDGRDGVRVARGALGDSGPGLGFLEFAPRRNLRRGARHTILVNDTLVNLRGSIRHRRPRPYRTAVQLVKSTATRVDGLLSGHGTMASLLGPRTVTKPPIARPDSSAAGVTRRVEALPQPQSPHPPQQAAARRTGRGPRVLGVTGQESDLGRRSTSAAPLSAGVIVKTRMGSVMAVVAVIAEQPSAAAAREPVTVKLQHRMGRSPLAYSHVDSLPV